MSDKKSDLPKILLNGKPVLVTGSRKLYYSIDSSGGIRIRPPEDAGEPGVRILDDPSDSDHTNGVAGATKPYDSSDHPHE